MQLLAVPDDGETVAAQAAGNRLDQHDGGAAAMAASTALPPLSSMRNPACRQRVRGGHHVAGEQRNADGGIGIAPVEGFHVSGLCGWDSLC